MESVILALVLIILGGVIVCFLLGMALAWRVTHRALHEFNMARQRQVKLREKTFNMKDKR